MQLPLKEAWRRPAGHPILWENEGKKWLLFGSPNPNVRVPATWKDVINLGSYEAYHFDGTAWRWQNEKPPTDSKSEHQSIRGCELAERSDHPAQR